MFYPRRKIPLTKAARIAAERIRRLEVQGARNVALTAIKAFEISAEETKAKNRKEFLY